MKRKIFLALVLVVAIAAVPIFSASAGWARPPFGGSGSSGGWTEDGGRLGLLYPPPGGATAWLAGHTLGSSRPYMAAPGQVNIGRNGMWGGSHEVVLVSELPIPSSHSSLPVPRPTPRRLPPRSQPPRPTPRRLPPRPAPVTCTPTYAAPSLYVEGTPYNPPHPVVIGQDPLKVGLDITFHARGGSKTNDCPRGDAQQRLVSFKVLEVQLAQSSREWITGELAKVYPGAYIKGQYPLPFTVKQQNVGYTGVLTVHIDPPDPGFYEFKVEVRQADGQTTVKWFSAPAYLLETTLIH